jgi:hypothetical protein
MTPIERPMKIRRLDFGYQRAMYSKNTENLAGFCGSFALAADARGRPDPMTSRRML